MTIADPLRLIALDEEDLAVISTHVQDAIVRVVDLAFRPAERRFALAMNRFDWEGAIADPGERRFERRRAILRFERVLAAKTLGINPRATGTALELLAVAFAPAEPPGGAILLTFAGGAAIRLEVECIEAQLTDIGAAWATRVAPEHDLSDSPETGSG